MEKNPNENQPVTPRLLVWLHDPIDRWNARDRAAQAREETQRLRSPDSAGLFQQLPSTWGDEPDEGGGDDS